jgi:SHS2 domain-containing protein
VTSAHWEHFHHGADIGVRGFGPSKESAFTQTALALTAVVANPSSVGTREAVHIACEAPDDEMLLVDWLNALVFEMATRRMLFGRFDVRLEPGTLRATAWGEPVDVSRHQPAVEVKGATFTELKVRPTDRGGWLAQCVVDV